MGLETATWIDELDPTNPTPTDPKSQGDDHLRLTKSVLQNQFPSLGQVAVTSSAEDLNGGLFDKRLAGYGDSGISETRTDDLNSVTVNSNYHVTAAGTPNVPTDLAGEAWVTTLMYVPNTWGRQLCYGMYTVDANKIWSRSLEAGVWQSWKLVASGNTGNVAMVMGMSEAAGGAVVRKNALGIQFDQSIRSGVGVYSITFATPLPDINYIIQTQAVTTGDVVCTVTNIATDGFVVRSFLAGAAVDLQIMVTVFYNP